MWLARAFGIIVLGAAAFLIFIPGAVPAYSQSSAAEVTLAEGTRVSLQLNDYLSTKLSNEGDPFTANVIAPVYVGEKLVIPKGSVVTGNVSRILRPGRFRGKALMNLVFHSVRIPGRGDLPIIASLVRVDSETISGTRDEGGVVGKGSTGMDAGRVATPSLAGAGIGAIAGGGKGAAVGAGVGAVVGLTSIFVTRGKDLEIRRGAVMEIALDRSLQVPAETEGHGPKIR